MVNDTGDRILEMCVLPVERIYKIRNDFVLNVASNCLIKMSYFGAGRRGAKQMEMHFCRQIC